MRFEWTVTEIELTSAPGRDDGVAFVSWECSGQTDNGDGTWTEAAKHRGRADVPYDPDAAFGDYRGMAQADVLAAWVFPAIDAPAIEAAVSANALKRLVQLPARVLEAARRDAEWQLTQAGLEPQRIAELEAVVAASTFTPTVTPSPVADVMNRDVVQRLPDSLK